MEGKPDSERIGVLVVPEVHARTLVREIPLKGGATTPGLFNCVDSQGNDKDYVVKSHLLLGKSIIYELVAVHLAHQLGVNVPDCAVVHIAPRLAMTIRDDVLRRAFLDSRGPHFGSVHLSPGWNETEQHALNDAQAPQAADIFAFDMLIQNVDRNREGVPGKINALFKGDQIFAIDHEKAFSFVDALEVSPPWELRGQPFVKNHLFYRVLLQYTVRHNSGSFRSFTARLAALPLAAIRNAVRSAPAAWQHDLALDTIFDHLELVKANSGKFERGLLEVFQ